MPGGSILPDGRKLGEGTVPARRDAIGGRVVCGWPGLRGGQRVCHSRWRRGLPRREPVRERCFRDRLRHAAVLRKFDLQRTECLAHCSLPRWHRSARTGLSHLRRADTRRFRTIARERRSASTARRHGRCHGEFVRRRVACATGPRTPGRGRLPGQRPCSCPGSRRRCSAAHGPQSGRRSRRSAGARPRAG